MKRSLRILHVMARYWPAQGGAEAYLHEISRRLVADGHQVTVATTDAQDVDVFWNPAGRRLPAGEAQQDGVTIRRFTLRHLPGSPLAYSLWRYHGLRRLAALPLPTRLLARLARYTPWAPGLDTWLGTTAEPYDLVAGAGILYEPFVDAALRFATRRGLPCLVYPFTHLGAGRRPGRDVVSRYYTMRHQVALVARAAAVVAMTATEKQFYVARGVPPDRVTVVGAGVTPDRVLGGSASAFRARYPGHSSVVAFIGALTLDKGAFHLVEAIRRLNQAGRPVSLFLIGAPAGPFERLRDSVPPAIRARLVLLGQADEASKRDLLAACDLLAMPSRTDSFGIVYLEAWLYRKPVIAARAWGMADVVADGQDGALVPFGDASQLANTIGQLLDDPARRAALGAQGERKVYAQHTWDHVYASLSELYARLAREPQAPVPEAPMPQPRG
jgi:glycogen(starch) synthase